MSSAKPPTDSTAESASPLRSHRRALSIKRTAKPKTASVDLSTSLRSEGPYVTYSMVRRLAEQEARKKWLCPKGFIAASRPRPAYIPNYVGATPSQVPVLHSFREVDKGKWLCGDFKPGKYSYKRLTT